MAGFLGTILPNSVPVLAHFSNFHFVFPTSLLSLDENGDVMSTELIESIVRH